MKKGLFLLLLCSLLLASSVSFAVDSGPSYNESTIKNLGVKDALVQTQFMECPTVYTVHSIDYPGLTIILTDEKTSYSVMGICSISTSKGFSSVEDGALLSWQKHSRLITSLIKLPFQYQICTATFYRSNLC